MREMLLLGAGASFSAGVPGAYAMTEKVLEAFRSEEVSTLEEAKKNPDEQYHKSVAEGIHKKSLVINYVLTGLKHYAAKQRKVDLRIDIEQFIGALETLSTRKESDISPFINSYSWDPKVDEFDELLSPHMEQPEIGSFGGLVKEIKWKVWNLVKVIDSKKTEYLSPIISILKKQHNLTIVTLNYDNTIELMCEQNGARLYRPPIPLAYLSWEKQQEFYKINEIPPREQISNHEVFEGITLLKLHGSFDWGYTPRNPIDKLYNKFLIEWPNNSGSRYGFPREPAIILKRGNKLSVDEPYPELVNLFISELDNAQRLTVIGYSFRDDHINTLIGRWFETNPDKQIQIIDPGFDNENNEFTRQIFYRMQDAPNRINIIRDGAENALLKSLWI